MASKKYLNDYRLRESVDENGRIRAESEYIGPRYTFAAGARAAALEKRRLLALCALAWAAYLAALAPVSAASRTAYVLLPFVFSGLPLGMLTATALSIRASDRPMERRDAERLENGLPPRALFAAVLSGAALLAQGLRFLLTEEAVWPGDAVFALGAAGVSVCAAAAFSRRKALSVQKEGPPAP